MADFISIGDYVLYNNHHLVAFNKPAGVPVQPDPTEDPSLLQLGSTYCKTSLQLIHRIDRPVSGVVLFAKRKDAQQALHQQFRNRLVQKTYLAITAAEPPQFVFGSAPTAVPTHREPSPSLIPNGEWLCAGIRGREWTPPNCSKHRFGLPTARQDACQPAGVC